MPSRDDLTVAWGDTVLDSLRPKLRAMFAAGRFTDVVDGTAHFALPNEAHRSRCESFRPDIEKTLTDHFDRPVPLRLVIDGDGPAGAAPASAPAASVDAVATEAAPEREEESIDMSQLEDAGSASTGVDQLADVFGAVDVIDESEESPS